MWLNANERIMTMTVGIVLLGIHCWDSTIRCLVTSQLDPERETL